MTGPKYTCVAIILFNQHLDVPHLSGGWIVMAREKCSPMQILNKRGGKKKDLFTGGLEVSFRSGSWVCPPAETQWPESRQDLIPSSQTQQQVISVTTSSSLVESAHQCNQLPWCLVALKRCWTLALCVSSLDTVDVDQDVSNGSGSKAVTQHRFDFCREIRGLYCFWWISCRVMTR